MYRPYNGKNNKKKRNSHIFSLTSSFVKAGKFDDKNIGFFSDRNSINKAINII